MARTFIRAPDWDPFRYGNDEAAWDTYIVELRDSLRTALDPALTGNDWIVTDVAKWVGQGGSNTGYTFSVYHMNGAGSATGPAWTFFFPAFGWGTNPIALNQLLGNANSGTQGLFFRAYNNTSTFSLMNSPGRLAVHYCETGATTTPYGAGWATDGSLTGGDLSAPTTNPYTDLETFMPGTSFLYGPIVPIESTTEWVFLFDTEKPFLALYMASNEAAGVNRILIAGKIAVPYKSTDTNANAMTWVKILFTPINSGQPSLTEEVAWLYNESGVADNFSLSYRDFDYTLDQVPLPSGNYPWEPVKIVGSGYFKGFLDTDVVRKMGRYNAQVGQMFDSDQFIKFHQSLCYAYIAGEAVFPGGS